MLTEGVVLSHCFLGFKPTFVSLCICHPQPHLHMCCIIMNVIKICTPDHLFKVIYLGFYKKYVICLKNKDYCDILIS